MRATTITNPGRPIAAIAALLLLLLAAQPVVAISWAGESTLASTDTYQPRIYRTGPSSAIAIWQRGDTVYGRRTTDGGVSWKARQTLASGLHFTVSASSTGSRVDLAFTKLKKTSDGSHARRLYYRRSLDGGATWQAARAMTSASSQVADQAVARHANGQVSLAWTGLFTGNIYMRTSADGGVTFGAARFVGHTDNWEVGRTRVYRGDVQLAIGTGVTYLSYTSARDTLSVRRTTNRGSSWSAAFKVSPSAAPEVSLVAAGSDAVIGFTRSASGMRAKYRRTTDKGATWSDPKSVVSVPSGSFSTMPQFAYRSGVLAVVFKFGTPGDSPIWYAQSTTFGSTWSARTRVSIEHFADSDPDPAGVAVLGSRRLAGYNENRRSPDEGFWVRRSQ